MKIDAQAFNQFLTKFHFTQRIETVVFEEREGNLSIVARDGDLLILGVYDEDWNQEVPIGVHLKSLLSFLKNQEEIDVIVTDRMMLKGKGSLNYKPINPQYVASRPELSVDIFAMPGEFDKRCYITKEDKGYLQNLLSVSESELVNFDWKGISSGDDTGNIIRFDIETGLDEGQEISVKKATLSDVLKKE